MSVVHRPALILVFAIVLSFGCDRSAQSITDQMPPEADQQPPESDPPAESVEAVIEEVNVCALNRAHLEYRRRQTRELPELFAAVLDVMGDGEQFGGITIEAAPYGPRISSSARSIEAVLELYEGLNLVDNWSGVQLVELEIFDADTTQFTLAMLTPGEPADDESCEFSALDRPDSFADGWGESDIASTPWAGEGWRADFAVDTAQLPETLDGLREELNSVDSGHLHWNGDTLTVSLLNYRPSYLAELNARSPLSVRAREGRIVPEAYARLSLPWIPADNWLDHIDDPRVEEHRAALERAAELYVATSRDLSEIFIVDALQEERAARGDALLCLLWAMSDDSEPIEQFDMMAARNRWRHGADERAPQVALHALLIDGDDRLSLTFKAPEADYLDQVETRTSECMASDELSWQRRVEDDQYLTEAAFDIGRGAQGNASLGRHMRFESAQDLLSQVSDTSTNTIGILQADFDEYRPRIPLLREAVPAVIDMEQIARNIVMAFEPGGINLARFQASSFGCEKLHDDSALKELTIDVRGSADSAGLLLGLYLTSRLTHHISIAELEVHPSRGLYRELEVTFASYVVGSDLSLCSVSP